MKKLSISKCLLGILLLCAAVVLPACTDEPDVLDEKPVIYLYPEEEQRYEKPAIYLYPEEEQRYTESILPVSPEEKTPRTEISVKLDYHGTLTSTYPAYNDGWNVLAAPDGTLLDPVTGKEYYCLFWEGTTQVEYDFTKGFCVKGEDTAAFLETTLSALGLTDREANEFIIYWLPRMETNPYNLIAFQTDCYTENAVLSITPQPDSMLRIFMAWQSLEEPIEILPQELDSFPRTGFVVVEWGGTEVKG